MIALIKAHAALLASGVFSFVFMGAGQSLYGPALPVFARDLGLSLASAGWLISAHWIGCILGVGLMFVSGARITPRIALAMMAAGAGLIALTPGLWGTLAGAVAFGAGYGFATVVYNPRVLAAFGDKGPSMLGLMNAVFSLGAISAPLVFVALGSSISVSFAIVAAGCAITCVFAKVAGKPEITTATKAEKYRFHWGILTFGMVAIGMEACLIGLGPTALIQAGETEERAAQLLSMFFVAFLVARIALIFVAQYLASFTLFTVALCGAALAASTGAWLSPEISFVAIGISAGVFFPSYFVTASRKMGTDARVPPTIITAGLVGGILAPVLMSTVMGNLGQFGFFWIIAGLAGSAAVAALVVLRPMND